VINEKAIVKSLEGLHEHALQGVTIREAKLRLYLEKLKELENINTSRFSFSVPNIRELIERFWSAAAMHLGYVLSLTLSMSLLIILLLYNVVSGKISIHIIADMSM